MKNLFTLLCFAYLSGSFITLSAQESDNDYLKRNPIYDYSESQLNNTDSIPGFETSANKLKISGTIYESDGVTPAKDVLLYIEQADEDGDYQIKTENNKRYMQHRAWVKTDVNGQYTFFTFVQVQRLIQLRIPEEEGLKKYILLLKSQTKPNITLTPYCLIMILN